MPMSANEVRHALRKLEDLRYAAGNLDEALRRIVDATHQLFAVDGAGLMLIDPDQLLRNMAVSDQRVHDLEELQIEHGEGPCVDAFEDKTLVDTEDLAAEARWPEFSPAAVERGLRAVLASPIPYNQHAIGVVVVFSAKAHPWSPRGGAGPGGLHRPGRPDHRQHPPGRGAGTVGHPAPAGPGRQGGDRAGQGGAGRPGRLERPGGV